MNFSKKWSIVEKGRMNRQRRKTRRAAKSKQRDNDYINERPVTERDRSVIGW